MFRENFKKWLQSPGGGGKGENQADQLLCKVLKYLKYCCADFSLSEDIPDIVIDYYLGSVTIISHFVGYWQTDWSLEYSGVTGYMNALGHLLDFRRSYNDLTKINSSVFIPSEIYIQRLKRYLSKKWNPIGEKFWLLIIWIASTARLNLNECKKLFHITPKNMNKEFWMQHHRLHPFQRPIYHLQRLYCCYFISYGKSFTPYEISIFDSADDELID